MAKSICALCHREVSAITWHHLIPKEEGGRFSEQVPLCQPCHSTIHCHFTNKELALNFNTIQKILESGRINSFLKWIRKQSTEYIRNKK